MGKKSRFQGNVPCGKTVTVGYRFPLDPVFLGEKSEGPKSVGEKSVQEEFLGEESLGEKYMGEKYVQERICLRHGRQVKVQ